MRKDTSTIPTIQPGSTLSEPPAPAIGSKLPVENSPVDKKPKKAKDKPLIVLIEKFLTSNGYQFRYNTIKNVVEYAKKGGKWTDVDERTFKRIEAEILRYGGMKNVGYTLNVFLSNAQDYDPMQQFLKENIWDGNDHIQYLASFVMVDADRREWFDLMFKKHLVRLVACAVGRLPFNKQCLVLHGIQGDGKSSFMRFLAPPILEPYYTETIDFESKDGLVALARNLWINIDEMDSLNRHDIAKIKAFLSYEKVKARLPFDRRETYLRRRATFFGTTNKDEFLTDETGNVRWLVMPIKGIIHDNGGENGYNKQVDINQAYAQAYALMESGFDYVMNKEEIARSEAYNSAHVKKPLEYELILKHFDPSQNKGDFKTVGEVKKYLEFQAMQKLASVEMIGKSLRMLNTEADEKWKFAKVDQRIRSTPYPLKGYLLREMGDRSLIHDEDEG